MKTYIICYQLLKFNIKKNKKKRKHNFIAFRYRKGTQLVI